MSKIKQRPSAARKKPNRRPDRRSGAARGGDRDFIEDAVRTGYEVSESWLRQGTNFARGLSGLSPPGLSRSGSTYRRSMELYMELLNNWFDLIGRYSDLMDDSQGSDRARRYQDDYDDRDDDYDDDYGSDYADADSEEDVDDDWNDDDWGDEPASVNVVFEVQSAVKTRMDLQFHSGGETNHVEIVSLIPLDGGGPPMSVSCSSPDEDTLLIAIEADSENQSGQYVGVVLDAANRAPVGTLSVQLG